MKTAHRTIKKYRDPLLMLSHLTIMLLGATLAKWPTWVEVWAAPLSPQPYGMVSTVEVDQPDENADAWVGGYINYYFTNQYQQSEMRMIMHCLLYRESKHDLSKGHGDGGLAGGGMQFHQDTWERMRGQMMKAGLISEIGSRYNLKEAIHTTIWAIKNGRALEWGPILRASKNNNNASCPKPSWY